MGISMTFIPSPIKKLILDYRDSIETITWYDALLSFILELSTLLNDLVVNNFMTVLYIFTTWYRIITFFEIIKLIVQHYGSLYPDSMCNVCENSGFVETFCKEIGRVVAC